MYSPDCRTIILHPEWMAYFRDNARIVRSFISWNWLDYMQRRNPSVPNLQNKLFPPAARTALTAQTRYWKLAARYMPFRCIYTGEPVTPEEFSLDHFLPWSFVTHDRMWNLVPASRSINSSKSNSLPSLEEYLEGFVETQYRGLRVMKARAGRKEWQEIIKPYMVDLNLGEGELEDKGKFGKCLEGTIRPLYGLAEMQGFCSGWVYEVQ